MAKTTEFPLRALALFFLYLAQLHSALALTPQERSQLDAIISSNPASEASTHFHAAFRADQQKEILLSYSQDIYQKKGESHFGKFLELLNQINPTCCTPKYFPYDNSVLDTGGLDLLIDQLKVTPPYSENNEIKRTQVVRKSEFDSVLASLAAIHFVGRINFIIVGDPHVTPLFLKTEGTETTAVITDSAGTGEANKEYLLYEASIAIHFTDSKIYIFDQARQHDLTSCPIFSIQDVFSHSRIDLFSYVESCHDAFKSQSEASFLPTSSSTYYVHRYPPEFMKVLQSVSGLRTYLESPKIPGEEAEIESLDRMVLQILSQDATSGHLKNDTIDKIKNLYINLLLNGIISSCISDAPKKD